EDRCFRYQLSRDPPASGTQTEAQSHFGLAFYRARQKESRNIDAGHDQNERHAAQRGDQWDAQVANQIFFQGYELFADIARFLRNAAYGGGEALLRHRGSHSRTQFADNAQELVAAPLHVWPARSNGVFRPYVGVREKIRHRWQHSDNGLADSFEMHYSSDYIRIAAKLVLPKPIRHNQGVVL